MNDIYTILKSAIFSAVEKLYENGKISTRLTIDDIAIELIKEEEFGDYSSNIAMTSAKKLGMPSVAIANLIIDEIQNFDFIEKAEFAKPGFINLTIKQNFLINFLPKIIEADDKYGNSSLGANKHVNIEFVSANPTGPIHAGHARGAVVGDALALILEKAGYKVTREYYINDYGKQVETLARSLYSRYLEALEVREFVPTPGEYPGEYLVHIAKEIAEKDGNKWVDQDYVEYFKNYAVTNIMQTIKADLEDLGVKHDVFTSETGLVHSGAVDKVIEHLTEKGLVYRGILQQPKGKVIDDWEPKEQVLFKSTMFGDDVDRPLIKSDGKWTYFASDIAYHLDKINRGCDALVNIFGADHGGYITRMKAAVSALKDIPFKIILTQLVKFIQNNQELKMSKRAGSFITARDVVDAVGKDVLRFVMLTRKSEAGLDFDFQKVTEQSSDNPVFYVQYASARANSILRQFKEVFNEVPSIDIKNIQLDTLDSIEEKRLIKFLLDFPRQIFLAATFMEPHRIAFFLQDLAAVFHSLWNCGKCNEKLRFVSENNRETSIAKCLLVKCVIIVITAGLKVLGIKALEEL